VSGLVGWRQLGGSAVEILAALAAGMLRVGQGDSPRTPRGEITNLVQCAGVCPIAISALAVWRTRSMLEVAAVLGHPRLGQSCWPGDPFRGMRPVRAGTEQNRASLGQGSPAKK
jgi:hypothetical protein